MYRNTIKLLCDNHYNKYFPNGKKETFIYTNIDTKKIIDYFKKINKNKDFLLFYSCEMNIKSKKCDEKIKFSDTFKTYVLKFSQSCFSRAHHQKNL